MTTLLTFPGSGLDTLRRVLQYQLMDSSRTRIALLLGGGVALLALTLAGLAPWLVDLLHHMRMPNAGIVGSAMAVALLVTAAGGKLFSGLTRLNSSVDRVIAVTLVLMSIAMFGARWTAAKNAEERARQDAWAAVENNVGAAKARRDAALKAAQQARDSALASAATVMEEGARRRLPAARRIAAESMTAARETYTTEVARINATYEVGEVPTSVDYKRANIVEVAGPAILELSVALLVELLGGMWGSAMAIVLLGGRVREETEESELVTHPALDGVDLEKLSADARRGLDEDAGTWHGLELGAPKSRNGTMWPTLANRRQTTYVGSKPALRAAKVESVNAPLRMVV